LETPIKMGELESILRESIISTQDFRELANSIPQIVWITGPEGGHTPFLNDRYYEYTGLSRDVPGTAGWDLVVHPDDKESAFGQYRESLASQTPWVCELRLRNAEGEYRWHLSRSLPIFSSSGALLHWVATSTDIHAQKQAEAAMKLAQERGTFILSLNDLVRSIRDPEQVVRLTVSAIGKHLNVNRSSYIEIDEEQHILRRLETYIHDLRPSGETYDLSYFEKLKDDFLAGISFVTEDIELEGRMSDEAIRALLEAEVRATIIVPIVKEGQLLSFFKVSSKNPRIWTESEIQLVEELAERTWLAVQNARAEAQVHKLNMELENRVAERTRELSDAMRRLEEFAYTASHDLRAPLRAIIVRSHMLMEDYSSKLPSEAVEHLMVQAEEAKRMSVLIDELLRYSRLARSELSNHKVDLSAFAQEIVKSALPHYPDASFEVIIEPGLICVGDPGMLKLALTNLMENAFKFSPSGGTIRVFSTCIDSATVFVVEDQGVGFEMEFADKIWLPFNRLVRDDEFPGTGIGLAHVSRIIQRHGGKLWVDSEPGKGSRFYFTV